MIKTTTYDVLEAPIRGEIFSPERLDQYAVYLANNLKISPHQKGDGLLSRVRENHQIVKQVYTNLVNELHRQQEIPPAGIWLVDNHFIIEDQIREIKKDLPKKYYGELPQVSEGELKGNPRIYSIALTLVAHLDSHLEMETIKRFTRSFQTITPLKSGELWAIPISLRIALIENLRRLVIQIIHTHDIKTRSLRLVQSLSLNPNSNEEIISQINGLLNESDISDIICIAQLSKLSREQNAGNDSINEILTKYLQSKNQTIEEIVRLDHLQQAMTQVTVGNIVTSMRLLSSADWAEFFENVSLVEKILIEDPASYYKKMDFQTRDKYRHIIERISKRTMTDETIIAQSVVSKAKRSQLHIGAYLMGDHKEELEKDYSYQLKIREKAERFILRHPTSYYLGCLFATQAILLILLAFFYEKILDQNQIFYFIVLAFIPVSDTAINLVNFFLTNTIPPRILPKLELKNGIPDEAKTFIVIPCLFNNKYSVHKLIELLEVHYLSNSEANLYFAILSDFPDANSKEVEGDQEILELAQRLITNLNLRYFKESSKPEPFYLFHRPRAWNPLELKWMGWERKRGKLEEFNHFLRKEMNTPSPYVNTQTTTSLNPNFLAGIKYVITLDADTQIPRETAKKLIGTILHPLNTPRLNPVTGLVEKGYCILQPRISITPTSSSRSLFAKIVSGHTGIDPYTTAVSDVYQDLFGEGIFVGKGLYDVDTFIACTSGKIKNDQILSHDLFESLYAKTALVTDIEFLDDYPSHYDSYTRRLHRWIRGDWQIAKWALPFSQNIFSVISRWKIIDNLRRSLVNIFLLTWIYFGLIIPSSPLLSLSVILLVLFTPALVITFNTLIHFPKETHLISHLRNIFGDFKIRIIQIGLSLLFLPHQTYTAVDAISRTLFRTIISKKNRLEWTSAAETESIVRSRKWPAPNIVIPTEMIVVVFSVSLLLSQNNIVFWIASPLLICWGLFPYISEVISKTKISKDSQLKPHEVQEVREIARRTWHFFETFVTEIDNWLAPDNFQEDPRPVVSHRTSPTNMGVLLLSSASAYDFGYLGSLELIDRLEKTQTTLDQCEKYKGHFYNWYDTTTLAPLLPIYISTVDSGNLAAHLITMKNFCLKISKNLLIENQVIAGIQDTLLILQNELSHINSRFLISPLVAKVQIKNEFRLLLSEMIESNKKASPNHFEEWLSYIQHLKTSIDNFADILVALELEHGPKHFHEVSHWTKISVHMIHRIHHQLLSFIPWSDDQILTLQAEVKLRLPQHGPLLEDSFKELTFHHLPMCQLKRLPKILQQKNEVFQKIQSFCETQFDRSLMPKNLKQLLSEMKDNIDHTIEFTKRYLARFDSLAKRYNDMAMAFDFQFLFNKERKIFTIGYNLTEDRMDNSYYDLLASEARLASFFAIAKGDVPLTHWFHLGRQISSIQGQRALVSWSASMFEYLMPLLIMRNYSDTLLHQTYESVVSAQISYAHNLGLPWGVSESAYNARDLLQFYQYGPFGIPGMGLKYGLGSDVVISPYSSALAAMINLKAALGNFTQLKLAKAYSKYGFYEAIDYTRDRLQKGHNHSLIKCFMVHHQGMILISLDNVLHKNIMQNYFHSDPIIKSTELLLQEKIPHHMAILPHHKSEKPAANTTTDVSSIDVRHFKNIDTPFPKTNILSNGTYTLLSTTAGSGYSRCHNIAVNRWSEDPTLDCFGSYIYFRDHYDQSIGSVTYQPLKENLQSFSCSFSEHKIEFKKKNPETSILTEIIVSPEDNVELRRVHLSNNSANPRRIDLTSYLEPVLARAEDDSAHLTFSKIFLETEYIASKEALLVHRRKRSSHDKEKWGIHVVISSAIDYSPTEYETDRMRFIGRGRSTSNPSVIIENLSLSNTTGTVLDPILSLRKHLILPANSKITVCFSTGMAESREEALRLIDQYHDIHAFDREQEMSWTQTQAQLRHLKIEHSEAQLFQELASALTYSNPLLRPNSENLLKNNKSQEGLWAHGISGDLPILIVKVSSERDLPLVKLILRAHEYLRLKKMSIDLVIVNSEATSYRMSLHDELIKQTHLTGHFELLNKNGGIFLVNALALTEEDKNLFRAFAKVVIDSNRGSLKDQLHRFKDAAVEASSDLLPKPIAYPNTKLLIPPLQFFNGLGGYNQDGSEYVIVLNKGQYTPAPWINVIANQNNFGFIISDSGNGYTWANNSRENRLTPWSNDPVNDSAGESLYLRDEESFFVWSPTPGLLREDKPYLIRHGLGQSTFEYNNHGIIHQTTYFASHKDNIKIIKLKLTNVSLKKRKLSATFLSEWTLGNNRSKSAHTLVTKKGQHPNSLLAKNPFNIEYNQHYAFCAISGEEITYTCDRKEFLGRNGSYNAPAGMKKKQLSKRCGAGFDPCAAMRSFIEINHGEEKEFIILLGQSVDENRIKEMIEFYLIPENLNLVLKDVSTFWQETNQQIQIKTPCPEFDLLMNQWLLYQTISCRMWARSALYQSGGAFGFRDQLQDSLGLLYAHPEIARAHILECAAHQFPEGDVQHWWHPPSGKGVRTRFSDDLLWLPYVVCKYISRTNDWSLLEENISFMLAPLLNPEQEDLYIQPKQTEFTSSLYDHCLKAINHSLKIGSHGLPLIGAGDWNDGMNNIGLKGSGESVWVGWFLAKVLKDFSPLCLKKNDEELAQSYLKHSLNLTQAIESNAWDGQWYLRAFFDDGSPLGSSQNDECQIDSLTQSWAALTGLGEPERQVQAMKSVSEKLVLKKEKLCLLFTPPFDHGVLNPGYIKGYPPGIRENGGQYNHAAIWSSMAFCTLGDGDTAFDILSYLNPMNRTKSFSGLQLYKVEPYVLAADIYHGPTHSGRGGWSWYTGSSSLYYQAGLESILGLNQEDDSLSLNPCIPHLWTKYQIDYKWRTSVFHIEVENPSRLSKGKISLTIDGVKTNGSKIRLVDDGKSHQVTVMIS